MSGETIARSMRSNRRPLDEDSAARLLQGIVHADDAPPGYSSVAALLAAAAARPGLDEDAGTDTISALVEAIRSTPAPATASRKSLVGKLFAGKALAAVAVVALTAGGAAAATGTLPGPVQGAVADAVSHLGVDIPHPDHGDSAGHRQDAEHRQDDGKGQPGGDHGQPTTDPAGNQGQQTSDAAHDAKTGATEAGDKVGPAVCTAVGGNCQPENQDRPGPPEDKGTPPDTSGSDNGQPADPGQPVGDNGREEDHAATPTTPTTPTTGTVATGEDRSGRDRPEPGTVRSGKPAD